MWHTSSGFLKKKKKQTRQGIGWETPPPFVTEYDQRKASLSSGDLLQVMVSGYKKWQLSERS